MKQFKILFIVFLLIGFSGCFSDSQNKNGRVRVNIFSDINDGTKVTVWVEGKDGVVVNGALVTCLSPGNVVKTMTFDSRYSYYYCSYASLVNGSYKITVDSLQFDGRQTIDVPNAGLTENIKINYIKDDDGLNSRNGEDLHSGQNISINWDKITGASSYLLEIKNNGTVIYNKTTNENTTVIEKGILSGSSTGKLYVLAITAQYQAGDPYYIDNPYFSTSIDKSIDYNFFIKDIP